MPAVPSVWPKQALTEPSIAAGRPAASPAGSLRAAPRAPFVPPAVSACASAPTSMGSPSGVPVPCTAKYATSVAAARAAARAVATSACKTAELYIKYMMCIWVDYEHFPIGLKQNGVLGIKSSTFLQDKANIRMTMYMHAAKSVELEVLMAGDMMASSDLLPTGYDAKRQGRSATDGSWPS